MKKILVVLLILAVAGGVFAQQGTWSLGGSVEIGTRVDFDPDPEQDGDDDPATADGVAYHRWDAMRGALSVGYTRGNAYVGFDANTVSQTALTTTFNGDTFRAKFQWSDLFSIIQGNEGTGIRGPWTGPGGSSIKRLWGEYKFVDGMVTLLAAFKGDAAEYWVSDTTGAFLQDGKGFYDGDGDGWFGGNPLDDPNVTFTYVDEWYGGPGNAGQIQRTHTNNYLLAAVDIGALNFGIMLPKLFMFSGFWGWGSPTQTELVKDVLKQMTIGVKFDQSPIEFAAQFQLENYGVYFGGTFTTGALSAGLSFMGILDGDGQEEGAEADPTQIKFGGKVEYSGSGFGGGVKAFYEREDEGMRSKADSDYYLTTIGIEPFLFYDAIPSHLRFKLDIGFYFLNDTDGDYTQKVTVWALQPQIFWNFLGTGAGTYWSYDTGIMIRYRMANADSRDIQANRSGSYFGSDTNSSVNFLDVVFKWGF